MPLVSSCNDTCSSFIRMEELTILSVAERPWRRRKCFDDCRMTGSEKIISSPHPPEERLLAVAGNTSHERLVSEAASTSPTITGTDVGNLEHRLPDCCSSASSDTNADASVASSKAVKSLNGIPEVLAEVLQMQDAWNADLWLRTRDTLLQSGDVRHMNELWQSVLRSTEHAISQQSYKVASQTVQLCSASRLPTSLTWFGQENAGLSPISSESLPDTENEKHASAINPPVLVCAASPLDILVHLRKFFGEDQPIILVADLADFDKSGNADLSHSSAVRPQCLPLRTDFKRYATEAAACLKGGSSTMRSHLCARCDPYVFLCPNVSVFRGSREAGYPFLSTPIRTHVIATAQVEARPSVQMMFGSSGKTEWYSDESAHAALLDRLNLISLVALNKAMGEKKASNGEYAEERPILILGTFGCGGGRSGRHPHHAIANALKHFRRHFSPFFHSIFVCCERDGGYGDSTRAALLDRVINRQIYRTLDIPGSATNLAPWHWDIRQLQLCIRPSKLMKVCELCGFAQNFKLPLLLGSQLAQKKCDEEDAFKFAKATSNTGETGALGKLESSPQIPSRSIGSTTWTPMDSRASIRRASTLGVVGGSSLQCSVYGGSPLPCKDAPDESSDDGIESSSSSESEGVQFDWFERSLRTARWSRTSSASVPHSLRGSNCRESLAQVQQIRQGSKGSSAHHPDCESRLSLSLFGWKSSNSRRASMLSRRSSAQSSRRPSDRNLDSQRPSVLDPEEGLNQSSLAVLGSCPQNLGANLSKPDSCGNSAHSLLAMMDGTPYSRLAIPAALECDLSSPRISLAIPEDSQLNASRSSKSSSSSRSHSRRTSVSRSSQSARRASISGAAGGNGRRMSCGQRLGPLARRLSVSGVNGRRASVSQVSHRRTSLGGKFGQMRRFSIGGELSCLPEQDCEKPSRGSRESRSSSLSSSRHSDEESDTPLDEVHQNRLAGELAERVEDIELLRRESFESLTKQLHKEKTRMLRRRSTLADLIGSSCLTSLVVAHEPAGTQVARESPLKEPTAKTNGKQHVHASREEINIRRQVRERLRNRRQTICCRRGGGSLVFAQHVVPEGLHDGGDDCLDERPAVHLTGAEQLRSGRRVSTFATICNSRNFVLGRM
mmetsp:Transcript_101234/g.158123  ORF Transcript_101234/g.158123 Transcript_101234/m.158123 type:complete len:1125 (+) Transcript_101234:71-3445(+)